MFCKHRVTEVVGGTVEELGDRITYKEFVDWIAYFKIKDEQFQKWEFYAAQIAAYIVSTHSSKPVKISDFTLDGQKPQKIDPKKLLYMIAQATGAKVNPNG